MSDCDHHVWGTGFRNRGKMASRFRSKTFWWRRIVLYPISNVGVPPFLCFQVPFSDWGEYTWRVVAPAKAQSANLWRSTCTTGSFRRGCQRRPQHARCNSWMRPGSSRIHVRAAGTGEANSVFKNVAAICGIGTPREFWVGVIARSSPTS